MPARRSGGRKVSDLNDHELTYTIRTFLTGEEVSLEKVERRTSKSSIIWDLKFEEVEVLFMLYSLSRNKGTFIWIQAVICRLDKVIAEKVHTWLLRQNCYFPHPFKFALSQDQDSVLIILRSSAKWISPGELHYRLERMGPFVLEMQERLKREFGLRGLREGQEVMPE
jgi:hypothetical protein